MRNCCGHRLSRRPGYILSALILLSLPSAGLDKTKDPARYGRQSWQTESGLPQNTIHAILQSHDGYLWLATEGGVVRFDGLKFVVYDSQNTPQLRSNNVRSLLEDLGHNLWLGTADGLVRFNGSQFETFTVDEGLPGNNVWSTYQDRSGRLWAITADGIAEYRAGRFQAYKPSESSSISIGGIAEDSKGFLWVGTEGGARLFAGGQYSRPPGGESLPAGTIEALLADNTGRIWIGTSNGLTVNQNGRIITYTSKDGLPSNRVASLYQDKEGTVWVGTDSGLARIANGKIERVPLNDSSGSIVVSMFEDREGSLWLGTDSGGLSVLRDEKFAAFTRKEGLSDDIVLCGFQDENGTVWVGTSKGGLGRLAGSRFSMMTVKDGLSSNVILALAEDSAGDLLAGTPDGLNIVKDGKVTVLTSADGLADDFIRSIFRDVDGSVWIGTRRGLSHWTRTGFKTYTQADGLGSDLVGAILRDRHNNLWIGTLQGLTRLNDGRFRTYTTKDGLASNVITALHEDSRGNLWIGTQGAGLSRFAEGKIFDYPLRLGLPSTIYGMLEDERQNLWITSRGGIIRVGEQDLVSFAQGRLKDIALASYGTADGLRVNECSGGGHPAAWKTKDGSLWFATLKGAATLNPQRTEFNLLPPPVVLESVSIDDQVFDPSGVKDVAPGYSRFSFEYAGLSFLAPHNIRFKYKLENFDRNWIDAGTRRVAYYTNIPPGKYRFTVLARNSDGVWNETGASLAFRLRPYFYQTYWFDLLLLLALISVSWGIYRWRVTQVKAQFNAVLAERNRIAREIHDTLAQGFVAVSVQLELVARTLSISSESAQELLKKTQLLVWNGLAEARRSIWELRSQGSESEDLPSRLSKVASEVTAATPIKVQFRVVGACRPLPLPIEDELVRIGKEALVNVVRHSEAKQVKIDLNFEAKKLRLAIADDGQGFAGEPKSSGRNGHFGLKGMRERARQIDAELTVKSVPGEGTQILVETVIN